MTQGLPDGLTRGDIPDLSVAGLVPLSANRDYAAAIRAETRTSNFIVMLQRLADGLACGGIPT